MHLIEQVFGKKSLYEILSCPVDADKAVLRKAYYRAALQYHPDRNASDDAHPQFQAISLAYQILHDDESRQEYDETGVIPDDVPDDDDKEASKAGLDAWKQYFDRIFGKVTASEIDAFATKYKCSDEEKRDVLKEFVNRKGNLTKMLDFIMLSEPRDAVRWAEDYILPAMQAGEIDETFKETMEKTLKDCKKKVDKENEEEMEVLDDEETETESDEDTKPYVKAKSKEKVAPKKTPPKKAKPTKAKPKKNDIQDLVASIQNKHRSGGSVFSSLGARYGVNMDEDDPLNDADFAKVQATLGKKRRK